MRRTAGLIFATLALAAALATGCSGGDEAAVESGADAVQGASMVTPSASAIQAARGRLDLHIKKVSEIPAATNRKEAHPYYMIHKAGAPVHGTVLLFHGFSNKPHQMALLAKYLYDNDFNVYVPTLAGQDTNPPAENWLHTQIKSELRAPIVGRLGERLIGTLSKIPDPLNPAGGSSVAPAPDSEAGSLQTAADALSKDETQGTFRFGEYFKAATTETEDDEAANALFAKYFHSNHMRYLEDAQARLEEVKGLGPVFAFGLSVGGAVALALAEHNPQTIKRVVVHAPFLAVAGKLPRTAVNLLGPLDIMKMNWGVDFPLADITAAGRFGGHVRTKKLSQALKNVGTFMVLTASDKAADIGTDEAFYREIGGSSDTANSIHRMFKYPASAKVPHPMTDPREHQAGTGAMNTRWKPLYRETLRFLVEGDIKANAFDQDLPAAGSVWNLPETPTESQPSPETLDGAELPPRAIR